MKFVILFSFFLLLCGFLQTKFLRIAHSQGFIPHFSRAHYKSLHKIGKIVLSKLKSPENSYRFQEITPETNDKHDFFNEIPFIDANANSTYLQNNIIHPASSALDSNFGYWCSSGSHGPEERVYWQGDFQNVESLTHLLVKWAYAPDSYAIYSSINGQDFTETLPWKSCASGEAHRLWTETFWWWKWKDTSFLEFIVFGEKILAKSIRIVMKKPSSFFFGIYEVKALERKTSVIIRTKFGNEDSWFCLLNQGNKVFVRDCVKGLSFSKGDEIFQITKDFKIQKQEKEKKCLGFSLKPENLTFVSCEKGKSKNEVFLEWEISSNESLLQVKKLNSSKKCVQALDYYFSLTLDDIQLSATSKMNDDQHNPENPFSKIPGAFWASSPGDQEVHYIVRFDEVPLKQIQIKWKFKPKNFLLQVLVQGIYWKTMLNVTNNNKMEEKMNEEMDFINGIRILFEDTDTKFNDLKVYGIEEFIVTTQFKKVGVFDCQKGENNDGKNWKIEDFNEKVNDAQETLSNYRLEAHKLYRNAQRINDVGQEVQKNKEGLQLFTEKATKLKEKLRNLIDSFSLLHDKVHNFKNRNLRFEESQFLKKRVISSLGSTRFKPGEDCLAIKRAFPSKRSGFYWIKPPCAHSAIRVFCDFSDNIQQDYYFVEDVSLTFSSIKEIKAVCAEYGLEPVDVVSSNDLKRLNNAFKYLATEFSSFIPIAYDPSCQKKMCTNKFYSLVSKQPLDPSHIFLHLTEELGDFRLKTSFSQQNDFLSLNLIPFSIVSTKLKGVICSTNNRHSKEEENWIYLRCSDSVRNNREFLWGSPQTAKFKVKCPKNCLQRKNKKAFVWGNEHYKDDSSICLAAIHNNKLDNDKGGFLKIGIFESMEGKLKFDGSLMNGIQSLDWTNGWDRYFTVEKYEMKCPGDATRNKPSLTEIKSLRLLEKDLIEINSDELQENKDKLQEIFRKKIDELQYFRGLASNYSLIFDEFRDKLKVLEKNELFPEVQESFLNKNSFFFESVEKLLLNVENFAKSKLNEKIRKKNELLLEKTRLTLNHDFTEDFSKKFEENWEISRELHQRNDSHNWTYAFSGSNTEMKTIRCIQLDEKANISSFLLLKNMRFYDGAISFGFMSSDKGLFGVAFRYKDAFNYYILEISKSFEPEESFKRLRKVKDGVSTELIRMDDGGFIENLWYKVEIKFQMDKTVVSVHENNIFNDQKKIIPAIFQIFDGDLVYGTLALVVGSISTVNFQDIKFESSKCIDLVGNSENKSKENKSKLIYLSSTCSRFKENFKSSFDFVWKKLDPLEISDSPSNWRYKSDNKKTKMIAQTSAIKGRKIDQLPAILELIVDKFCHFGVITVSIIANSTGYAGIGFLYQDYKNFFALELHSSNETNFCRLRKISNGIPSLIQENLIECSGLIEKEQWVSVVIELDEERLLVYLSKESSNLKKVFEMKREEKQDKSKVALLSYDGIFGFADFEMMPLEDYHRNNEKILKRVESKITNKDSIYGECLRETTEEREKYCKKKFEFNFERKGMSNCNINFCTSCCELEVIASHKRRECEQKCHSVFLLESSDKTWRKCVEQDFEDSETYRECENAGRTPNEIINCKRDLCSLCCLKGKHVLEYGNNEKCQAACSLKFINL